MHEPSENPDMGMAERLVPRDIASVPLRPGPPAGGPGFDVWAYYFHGRHGFEHDREARTILGRNGGEPIGAGTFLPTQERDIQYRFRDRAQAETAMAQLTTAGFRVKMQDNQLAGASRPEPDAA